MDQADAPQYLLPREGGHTVELVPPDPTWPQAYAAEQARIRAALGALPVEVHHTGSTSVPGLAAKAILDIVLLVPDSRREDDYVPALVAAGYRLHLREPAWHEHRLLKDGPAYDAAASGERRVNLHVFTTGSSEAQRMLVFRDWLRTQPADRELYQRTKQALAGRQWAYVQDYADAKSAVVAEILQRALAAEAR